MTSKKRDDGFIEEVNQRGKATTDHGDAAENNTSDVPPALSALANNDPCLLTSIFEPSKIKNFLYKTEPNIAKINAASLDLISTTATLILKTLVEKVVLREQDDIRYQMYKKTRKDVNNENQDASLRVDVEHFLLTSNQLRSAVSANSPSSLDFLEATYENFRDKDGSFLPSKLNEYIPRKAYSKKQRTSKRSAAKLAGTTKTTTLKPSDCEEGVFGGNENNNKRSKRNHTHKGSSSLSLSSKCCNDDNPFERTITNAPNAKDNHAFDKIVEDEDDYD